MKLKMFNLISFKWKERLEGVGFEFLNEYVEAIFGW